MFVQFNQLHRASSCTYLHLTIRISKYFREDGWIYEQNKLHVRTASGDTLNLSARLLI